jgi:hypothetical protein
MDSIFNHMPGSEFYRAQVFPELFPHEKPMLVDNWPLEDQIMWTGVSPEISEVSSK